MQYRWYFLTIVLAVAIGVVQSSVLTNELGEQSDQINQPAFIGGPFSLVDHHGKNRSDRDFRGQYMLLYFGYTFCPDVCPTALLQIAASLNEVEDAYPGVSERLQPVFISLDPERDSQRVLAEYVSYFHPRLVGLTGTDQQIEKAAREYSIFYERTGEDSDSYLLDHSSVIYLVDPAGDYIQHFGHENSTDDMVQTLIDLLVSDANSVNKVVRVSGL